MVFFVSERSYFVDIISGCVFLPVFLPVFLAVCLPFIFLLWLFVSWCSFRLGRAGARELAADVLIDRQAKIVRVKTLKYEEIRRNVKEEDRVLMVCVHVAR